MNPVFTLIPSHLATQVISIVIMVVAPFVAGFVARRRLGTPWRVFWMGALVFVVSQMLLRIPIVSALQIFFATQITAGSLAVTLGVGAALALTAAMFETAGRYAGYRWLLRRDPKQWSTGVMYGLGHGGIESALLIAGVSIVQLVTLMTMTEAALAALPPVQAQALTALASAINDNPAWMGLAGGYERIVSLAIHVALSLLVLEAYVRRQWRWVALALAAHFAVDFVTPVLIPALLPVGVSRQIVQYLALTGFGILAIWISVALRRQTPTTQSTPATQRIPA
ncbi:MAG TPA: YhfC family intramembrane metalloprotease [Chloroflexi bacterium]|nr:YhfC family intramembrane metalloprotease [Chloroflexota bacterium]